MSKIKKFPGESNENKNSLTRKRLQFHEREAETGKEFRITLTDLSLTPSHKVIRIIRLLLKIFSISRKIRNLSKEYEILYANSDTEKYRKALKEQQERR